jgi:hypothetical protein
MSRSERSRRGRHLHLIRGAGDRSTALTDFLLACIAEDEEAAHDLVQLQHDMQDPAAAHSAGLRVGADAVFHVGCIEPSVLLAECDAKRQIAHLAQECTVTGEYVAAAILDSVVRMLAAPYAGRPGYDEGWRP